MRNPNLNKSIAAILIIALLSANAVASGSITFAFTTNYLSQLEPVQAPDSISSLGGAARLGSAIRNLRLSSDRFILLDTGNHFAGYTYADFRGEPEIELMNHFRYDAMSVGETELSMSEDLFDNWSRTARFRLLLSNLIAPPQCKLCRNIVPFTIVERVGITVGIFALLPPEIEFSGRLTDDIEIDGDIIGIAEEIVDILVEKCDVIVLLSQLDIDRNLELAEKICDIDLIMCNSWAEYTGEPVIVENETGCVTIIGCGGSRGSRLGVLNTTWDDSGGLIHYEWAPIDLDNSVPVDPAVVEIVEKYIGQRPKPRAIGRTSVELDGRNAVLRGAESNLGNLVADAMLEAFPGADLALLPGGSIWGDAILPAGSITDRDVFEFLPYNERAVLIEIEGETLKEILEHSVGNMEYSFGGFFQIAGATVKIDTSRRAQLLDDILLRVDKSGSRVRKIVIAGEKMDGDEHYKLVTTDFVATGGYGYFWFDGVKAIEGRTLVDIVTEYIGEKTPVAPAYEDRIVVEP